MRQVFILIFVLFSFSACQNNSDFSKTANFYHQLIQPEKPNAAKLSQFLTAMPKGGDLHHHYSGSIYAETYLEWVKDKGWTIDSCSLNIIDNQDKPACKELTVSDLIKNRMLYRKLLALWSDKDFGNFYHEQVPSDQHFFSTFGYFDPVVADYKKEGLRILRNRAIKENVSYIETIIGKLPVRSTDYYSTTNIQALNNELHQATSQKEVDSILEQLTSNYLAQEKFQNVISSFINETTENHKNIDTINFKMRYQTYALRVLSPMEFYVGLLAGYLAAEKNPLIVGVNIVAPENNPIALRDYTLHMRMFNYLKRKYPNVNRALHAGELTIGMVSPKHLLYHIHEAIDIASAQRIGHGIDLPYETDSYGLLQKLKTKDIPIEINLTSNEFILGVKKEEHPYLTYSSFGVPLVISTDDSGVSRNNLSKEYLLLATRYRPSYSQLKQYVYNSINYSFLSLDDKKEAVQSLNKQFEAFEDEIATVSSQFK